jgi:hypothetical protein
LRHYVAKPYDEVAGKNLDGIIRAIVSGEIDEEQLEFRQGRGTTDGMFALK